MATIRVQHLLSGKLLMVAMINQIGHLRHYLNREKDVGVLCGSRYSHASHIETWGYYQGGILLLNRRDYAGHTGSAGDDASIFIATDKNAMITPSDRNIPLINQGEFVKVWNSGKWIKEGPWQEHIETFLEQVIALVDKLEAKKELVEKEESRIKKEEQQCEDEALIKEWS